MRLIAAFVLAGCVSLSAAADEPKEKDKPKENTNAEKLVGNWKLVKSSQGTPDDATFYVEFTKKGEMTLRIEPKEKGESTVVLKGTYKLDKDKIDYTIDDGSGGKKQEILTIKKLTADDLVTTDPEEIKEEFKRVKEDKKPEKKKD